MSPGTNQNCDHGPECRAAQLRSRRAGMPSDRGRGAPEIPLVSPATVVISRLSGRPLWYRHLRRHRERVPASRDGRKATGRVIRVAADTEVKHMSWMIYGAYGYTGRLVSALAAERGELPVIAGRDQRRLRELGERFELEHRT